MIVYKDKLEYNNIPFGIVNYIKENKELFEADCFSEIYNKFIEPDNVDRIPGFNPSGLKYLVKILVQLGFDFKSVSTLFENSFSSSDLVSISIPGNIIIIKSLCFFICKNLSNVVLNEGLEKIESGAFAHCHSLKTVKIPKSVKGLGSKIFFDSGIEKVYIPKSLVPTKVFYGATSPINTLGDIQKYLGLPEDAEVEIYD